MSSSVLSMLIVERGLRAEPAVPYVNEGDGAYQEFLHSALASHQRLRAHLPKTWRELPIQLKAWKPIANDEVELRITQFVRGVSPELVGWYKDPKKPWFVRTGLAVWQLDQDREPTFVGPDEPVLQDDQRCSYVGSVLIDDEPPLLVFATERRQGVLRRIGQRYVLDPRLTIAPGE